MIDMGQALSAQDRRDSVRRHSWPSAEERAAQQRMLRTMDMTLALADESPEFMAARADWLALRSARLAQGN